MTQKLSNMESILIIVSTIVPSAILGVPSITVLYAGQDSWISMLIAMLFSIAVVWFITLITSRLGEGSVFDWLEQRCGRIISLITGLLLAYYYGTSFCIILKQFINFIRENVLMSTPSYALLGMSLLVVIYAVNQGLQVIARMNVIVFFFSMSVYALLILFLIHNLHFSFLLPVLETPVQRIIQGSLTPLSWLSEGAVLLLLYPFLAKPAQSTRVGIIGVVIAGGILLSMVVMTISVFGPKLVPMMVFSSFSVVGIIKIGSLIERVDLLFISFWICAMYAKLAIFLFATCHCFSKALRIREDRPFILVIGLIGFLIALTGWERETDISNFSAFGTLPHLLTFNVLLPIGIGILVWLSKYINKSGVQK